MQTKEEFEEKVKLRRRAGNNKYKKYKDVLGDLFDATNSYECWACNRDDNLEIVSLADYTKQVRKKIVQEIIQEVKKLIDSKDFKLCNHEYANGYYFGLQYDLAKILDQIQG